MHAARDTGCDALHPGYGFLSERAILSLLCDANGVAFVGPEADMIEALGDKLRAREMAGAAGVPLVPEGAVTAGGNALIDAHAAQARLHMPTYGTAAQQIAAVAAKNNGHSAHNPRSQYRTGMSVGEVPAARSVAWPLTVPMCAPISDGSAATILCSGDAAAKLAGARIRVRACHSRTGSDRAPGDYARHVMRGVAAAAYAQAGIGPEEIDVAEVHDVSSSGEIVQVEALALCPPGEAGPRAAGRSRMRASRWRRILAGSTASRTACRASPSCRGTDASEPLLPSRQHRFSMMRPLSPLLIAGLLLAPLAPAVSLAPPIAATDHQRALGLRGAPNFRDLGGYRTTDGREVRWGLVYRSNKLSALTPADIGRVQQTGIASLIDFRTAAERSSEPDRWEPAFVYQSPKATLGPVMQIVLAPAAGEGGARQGMRDLYARMPEDYRPEFAALLHRLAASDAPLVMHCTAGKDRTGVGSAILLSLLGVPRATVVADYALTDQLLPPAMGTPAATRATVNQLSPETQAALLAADPSYIAAALDAIDRTYGSVDDYAAKALGLSPDEIARLRDRLLVRTAG